MYYVNCYSFHEEPKKNGRRCLKEQGKDLLNQSYLTKGAYFS